MTSCRDGLSVTSGAAWAQSAATHVCPLYIAGLIEPGDGKSVRPMAERMAPGDHDQFHHVIASGIWRRGAAGGPACDTHRRAARETLSTGIAHLQIAKCSFGENETIAEVAGEMALLVAPETD